MALACGFALPAIYWVFRNPAPRPPASAPTWGSRNRKLMALPLALLPIQFVLLGFGEPHGTTDAIGVLLTIAQCPLLALALYPWSPVENRRG